MMNDIKFNNYKIALVEVEAVLSIKYVGIYGRFLTVVFGAEHFFYENVFSVFDCERRFYRGKRHTHHKVVTAFGYRMIVVKFQFDGITFVCLRVGSRDIGIPL